MSDKQTKLLLIEDEQILAEMYRDEFEKAGFAIEVAFDAKEGLAKLKKQRPDLIILDILLPRENGISFLEKVRKSPKYGEIGVVALSNYDEPKTKQEAYDLKVKAYLLKTNYTPTQLIQEIRKYLPEESK